MEVKIWREGEQLVGRAWGQNAIQGAFAIFPESETRCFLKINGAQLTFIKDNGGQVTTVIYHSYGARFPDCEGKKALDEVGAVPNGASIIHPFLEQTRLLAKKRRLALQGVQACAEGNGLIAFGTGKHAVYRLELSY